MNHPQTARTGFSFTKIVVIESLEAHEVHTGEILTEFLRRSSERHGFSTTVEYISCENSPAFLGLLRSLASEARTSNHIPLVHVECHGDVREGLEFANGSTLSWTDLGNALLEVNTATNFNLLASFSACFGGHFLSRMDAVSPAPCWGIVAPTKTIDPAEAMAAFRVFYDTLFRRRDVGYAIASIARLRVSNGRWFGQVAELWFERIVIGYVRKHCTKAEVHKRARKLYRRLARQGKRRSIGSIKRQLRKLNRENLLNKYFDTYFMAKRLPGVSTRFASTRKRLARSLVDLRSNKDLFI